MKIRPAKRLIGTISLPGDKSVSHRAAMLGAIASGTTTIRNFSTSVDCGSTLECLRLLGADIETDGSTILIRASGAAGLQPPAADLDCGNSGTTMRLLAGILAGQQFDSTLTGDASLIRRPMGRIIEPLKAMGAAIESDAGRAPLRIHGRRLRGIRYEPPVASAQIKSAVLLAGLFADGTTTVVEAAPTRDHTERMLPLFGVDLVRSGSEVSLRGPAAPETAEITVPGDISSAAFFIAAAALLPGSDLTLAGVGLNPTRTAFLDVMRSLGAGIAAENVRESSGEPSGDLKVRGTVRTSRADGILIAGSDIPNLIDELPVLAVAGTQIEGGLEVRGAAELRVKETDRIAAVVANLRRMNADVEEFDDGFRVARSQLKGAAVDPFGDHRIAMAFAVAGLLAEGETNIDDAACVDVSFPGFFESLAALAYHRTSIPA